LELLNEKPRRKRRGIAEYIPVPADHYREADFVLELDPETWAKLYLSRIDLEKAN